MTVFTDFFTKLRSDLDQAHHDRQNFYRQTRAHVEHLARQVRNNLTEFASDLQAGGQAFRRCRK
jgi:hypothetical protein